MQGQILGFLHNPHRDVEPSYNCPGHQEDMHHHTWRGFFSKDKHFLPTTSISIEVIHSEHDYYQEGELVISPPGFRVATYLFCHVFDKAI